MREGVPLVHVLLFWVNNFGIAGVNNTFNVVSRVVNLSQNYVVVDPCVPSLNLVLRLHLNHLAALAHQVVACRHELGMPFRKL